MPYRIDIHLAAPDVAERLITLGALDLDATADGAIAALLPDATPPDIVRAALGRADIQVSAAVGRDADSVWVLRPRAIHVGGLQIVPDDGPIVPGTLRVTDGPAFGTGLHPTTALCLEEVAEIIPATTPPAVLDVGTGSGILALAALALGVRDATGVDVDEHAVETARQNARRNGMTARLHLARGGPDAVRGTWPLVLANVLAAPLMEMAPALARRLGHHGQLVLSGIPTAVEAEVTRTFQRRGLHHIRSTARAGWVAVVMQASW